jgi:hypothetical protein
LSAAAGLLKSKNEKELMMAEKKRPNKRAKAVAKLLKDSELLAAKTTADSKTEPNFKPLDASTKTSAANKMRPEKKRG